jgi:Subtilase family
MSEQVRNLPHLNLPNHPNFTKREDYTYPGQGGGGRKHIPYRDRDGHATQLRTDLASVFNTLAQEKSEIDPNLVVGESGFYLDVKFSAAEKDQVLQSLEDLRSTAKIELMTVTPAAGGVEYLEATLFVPDTKMDFFEKKIDDYQNKDVVDRKTVDRQSNSVEVGKPKNEALITCVETFSLSSLTSLFTDEITLFPQDPIVAVWWEVWLRKGRRESFDAIAEKLNIRIQPHSVKFIEREVVVVLASVLQLGQIIRHCDASAELRIAKDFPSFFFDRNEPEMQDWMNDLLSRCVFEKSPNVSICLLDRGVARVHPLLENGLSVDDMHSYEPAWGVGDDHGHGTSMAGLALYSDLCKALVSSDKIRISHCLESVKMWPPRGKNDPDAYGWITQECISRAEVQAPLRKRVICMPLTQEGTNSGVPSSWSAAIDNICFGRDEFSDELVQRLIIVPVGNIRDAIDHTDYLTNNDTAAAENPSQSWNALVVGAFTEKVNIVDPKYQKWKPIAPAGELSPTSRTSLTWGKQWPNRPDVVFEGGNLATDGVCAGEVLDDLSLLTVHHKVDQRLFTLFSDTSAATALAGYFAAQILVQNPNFWPETVRALIIHSATWTAAMRKHLPAKPQQKDKMLLLRRYGYGVPSLVKALRSAKNDLTMIVQDGFQPFQKKDGRSDVSTKDMNFHTLPWPQQKLESLGEREVEMRVTLSYFVEPNPGERGWVRRYSYPSYGLRFITKKATEMPAEFMKRATKDARVKEEKVSLEEDKGWLLGSELRDRGSLHSDIWTGTAADLAAKNMIGVHPVGGWWKERPFHNRWGEHIRYALIVSIRVMGDGADIYTPVKTLVRQTLEIKVET